MYQKIIDHPWISGTLGAILLAILPAFLTGYVAGPLVWLIYWCVVTAFAWDTKDKRTKKEADESWKDNLVH